MTREMLINVAQEDECRIAIVEKGKLEELYIERLADTSHVGNIYKGKITNVEPSIQACFVDFGIGKNGFLHISDLQSSYFQENRSSRERVGRKRPRRDRPLIQDCLRRGQELIVQVIKEGIGTKGPTLTTYLSIPGRYLVLMPGMNRLGVSRKIEDDQARARLREVLKDLNPPKNIGFIIRTAGMDANKRELQRDMNYLQRLWSVIEKKIKNDPPPAELYQESDLVTRTIRDIFDRKISRILCDSERTVRRVKEFLRIAMPRTRTRIHFYDDSTPLFTKHGLEEEIDKIQARHVPLPSGGSLVVDTTEAIVAIDVNSGKYRAHENAETTAYKINMEAAPEIARQLRLRDLGGLIIMDFIDMLSDKHRRAVEKCLRQATSEDRARSKMLRISQFGIIEMTRQRMRPSLKSATFADCPHCKGSGLIKTAESMAIGIMRSIQSLVTRGDLVSITVELSPEVASYLQNRKRSFLAQLEQTHDKHIVVRANPAFTNDQFQFTAQDTRGSSVNLSDNPG